VEPFANLQDAGHQLGGHLRRYLFSDPDDLPLTIAPIMPNGVPVLVGMRGALPAHQMCPLRAEGTDHGLVINVASVELISGHRVVVVDDGVETGTAARAAFAALRELNPAEVLLAVPVCSRQTMAELALHYDDIIAVHTPLGRRDLRWHYQDFDTIDEQSASAMLAAINTPPTPG
jgi:orotate phosphoribosyltransferase